MAENILFNPMVNAVIVDKVSYVVQVQPPSVFLGCETTPQLAGEILQCLYETKQVVYRDAVVALENIISPRRENTTDIDKLDMKLRMEKFLDTMLTEVKELKRQEVTFDEDACPSYESTVENTLNKTENTSDARFELPSDGVVTRSDSSGSNVTIARAASVEVGASDDRLPSYDEVMAGDKFKTVSYF